MTLSRVGGTASTLAAIAWLVLFGRGTAAEPIPFLEGLMWAIPLGFGLGTVALYAVGRRRLDRLAAWTAGSLALLSAASLLAGSVLTRGAGAAAYAAWLGFVGGIALQCGLVVAYGATHQHDRADGRVARIVLVAAGLPFAFLVLILGYKLATGWWVTDPALIELGTAGAAMLVGGAWLVIGIALWTRSTRTAAPEATSAAG